MTIEISQQLRAFLASGLLGVVLGLMYDLLRAARPPGRCRGLSLLDGLYCLAAFAAVFYFTMSVGDGELRLYMVVGIALGAVLFFTLLSQWLRPVWAFWRDCLAWAVSVLLLPAALLERLLKKFGKWAKISFPFWGKWFTIMSRWRVVCFLRHKPKKGGCGHSAQEKKKSWRFSHRPDPAAADLRRGYTAVPHAGPLEDRSGRRGRSGRADRPPGGGEPRASGGY